MREADIIDLLRPLAANETAAGLADDTALWSPPIGRNLVLTHDIIAEGVHYLPDDSPSDIAWKLVAVNLSDLAAKGATPRGVLLGLSLSGEDEPWLQGFADGLGRVLAEFGVELWGGDTVRAPTTSLGCTAIGDVVGRAVARVGGAAGDRLYVTGTIGDAGLGLAARRGEIEPNRFLERRYRLPMPRVSFGEKLSSIGATAAMDVSDGLLIDARRLSRASGCGVEIFLKSLPLSDAARPLVSGTDDLLAAARAGDDYELLFSLPPGREQELKEAAEAARLQVSCVGHLLADPDFRVFDEDGTVIEADVLGYEH
ncbi:thiamine-phosphate kinase [Pacificimonas flava]|uniref:Thiamine-monophosphate kinase n=2 Tax=Pacificimonas TaxID=1960290 RepID=A0A219B652_9SPHN|nr:MULTISPECIES: thiamine-phosphate kinase [Pacificimonas]MBZ6379138.1 thiamine-phosphate kinase [Pacificimonas aurantium]OWV33633.1 thiamine-phosphate kinase [Pacificimonas flava]